MERGSCPSDVSSPPFCVSQLRLLVVDLYQFFGSCGGKQECGELLQKLCRYKKEKELEKQEENQPGPIKDGSLAQDLKLQGNKDFKKELNDSSLSLYSKAIFCSPFSSPLLLATCFGNRGAVLSRLGRDVDAMLDITRALRFLKVLSPFLKFFLFSSCLSFAFSQVTSGSSEGDALKRKYHKRRALCLVRFLKQRGSCSPFSFLSLLQFSSSSYFRSKNFILSAKVGSPSPF